MSDADETRRELLRCALSCAVPLEIHRMRGLPLERVLAIAGEAAQVVASDGDKILYRVPGKSGPAFAALARGVAALAFAPGGVRLKYLDLHFQAEHPETCPREQPE